MEIPRLDKTAFSVTTFKDMEKEEKEYWLSKTPIERLNAIELNRRMIYGENRATSRLQRFLDTSTLTQC